MKRYFGSFFITLFIYASATSTLIYLYSNTEFKEKKDVSPKIISLNHVEIKKSVPKKIEEVQKVEEIKEEVAVKEVVENKVIKEEPKPIKKTIKSKKIVKKEIKKAIEKPIQKVVKEEVIEKPTKKVVTPIVKKDEKKEFLNQHLSQIRALINKNIIYPKRARKMNIQGIVKVKFEILKNGTIGKIDVLTGHKFLQKSTIEAIKRASTSFPKTTTDIDIKIPISYKLI